MQPTPEPGTAQASIRDVVAEDLPRILTLEKALFGPDDWSEGIYREAIMRPDQVYRARELGGALVGWGGVLCAPTASILTLGVDPAFRRQGHGSAILADLIEIAESRGAHEIFLEVRAEDEGAQDLYRAFGFTRIGIRRRYYQMSGSDAVVMRRKTRRD